MLQFRVSPVTKSCQEVLEKRRKYEHELATASNLTSSLGNLVRPSWKIVLPVACLIVAGGAYFTFKGDAALSARGGDRTRLVKVEVAKRVHLADRLEAIGTLQANESVTLTAKTQGIIRSINFQDSQIVKQGEAIASIDAGEQNAQVRVEEANLAQQHRELDRALQLVAEKHISESRVDEIRSAVKKAEANLASASVRADDRRIIAPFSGIIGTRRISLGALVSPGTAIATLDDISVMKLDFTVPETFLGSLKVGLPVEAAASAYRGEIFKGEVVSIDSRIDPATRSVAVRALLPNTELRLRPGMLMVADLVKDARDSIVVSENAVQPENDKQYVFVVSADGLVKRTEIKLGARQVGTVEVLSGVNDNALLIVEGLQDLRDGTKVKITNPEVVPVAKPQQPAEARDRALSRG